MNYYLDTEFYEDGERIHLISIGIVCEDGRELYLESRAFDWSIVPPDHWIIQNVKPHLSNALLPGFEDHEKYRRELWQIRKEVEEFTILTSECAPVFWGYFADYDWVVLCQLFGRMVDLPKGFPFFCMDLKQSMVERGLSAEWKRKACPDPKGEHHALVDARWNMELHKAIMDMSK